MNKEQLSEEARIMCTHCIVARPDGTCKNENIEIETQNKLAEEGECTNARIRGLRGWSSRPKGCGKVPARRRKEGEIWISKIDGST